MKRRRCNHRAKFKICDITKSVGFMTYGSTAYWCETCGAYFDGYEWMYPRAQEQRRDKR